MFDVVEKIGSARVWFGNLDKGVYVSHLGKEPVERLIQNVDKIDQKNKYEKILGRIPEDRLTFFLERGYSVEAKIPKLFNQTTTGYFVAHYLTKKRSECEQKERNIIESVKAIAEASAKKYFHDNMALPKEFRLGQLRKNNLEALADLHKLAYWAYPKPISDPEFIADRMDRDYKFYGLFHKDVLVISAMVKLDVQERHIEIVDFAIHPDYRGQNLHYYLVAEIKSMAKQKAYNTVFTMIRAKSYGLNITFCQQGFQCGGTLVNNALILDQVESMNVWYFHV